jgi:hypothetical protein
MGVNIDYEPKNWDVRRELELAIGIFVPCGFLASTQGWSLLKRG